MQPEQFLHLANGSAPLPSEMPRQNQLHPKSLVLTLISMNPAVEVLKPGTDAAKRVRNANVLAPAKPMGTRTRRAQNPFLAIMRGTESHALAMVLTAFLLFMCSGVFWVSHKQPEETPPFPLPERAEPVMLSSLRHPPIPLRHGAGVRSFP